MPTRRLWGSVADMVPGFSHGSNAIQVPIVRERAVWRLYSWESIVECREEPGDCAEFSTSRGGYGVRQLLLLVDPSCRS